MVIRHDGEVKLASEDDLDGIPKLDDYSDVEYVVQGESLIIRRSLSVHVCEEDVEQQRDNIYHTKCYIDNNFM
jgi:hypothetical protein